jgi:RNA polymerase sigma-70 factor (ECF subfamily)
VSLAAQEADGALAARAAGGDPDALDELVERCWARFYRVALGITALAADAEDAAQDAVMRLIERLGSFDPAKGDFSSWSYRLAANVAFDLVRSRARRAAEQLPGDAPAARADDPPSRAADGEMAALVLGEIASLPEQQRAVITLRDGEGLDTDEVARILSTTPGNVRAQLHYARRKVAAALAARGITA